MKISTVCLALGLALAAGGRADAQDFLNQDWMLDPRQSHVWMQTTKQDSVVEKHQFTASRAASPGTATRPSRSSSIRSTPASTCATCACASCCSKPTSSRARRYPPARQGPAGARCRPTVRLSADVQRSTCTGSRSRSRPPSQVTRIGDTTVSVATIEPIVVTAESFELRQGAGQALGRGRRHQDQAVGRDDHLRPGVRERRTKPELEAERISREQSRAQQETAALSTESLREPVHRDLTSRTPSTSNMAAPSSTPRVHRCSTASPTSPTVVPPSRSTSRVTPTASAAAVTIKGSRSSARNPWSTIWPQKASPRRASSRPDTARSARSRRTKPKRKRAKNRRIEFKVRKE